MDGVGTGGGVTLWVLFGRNSFKTWEFHWKLRGEKRCNISNLNGILNSKHIFASLCAKMHFWSHIQLPSKEKRNVSMLLCVFKHFGRIRSETGCKKCLKAIIFALIEVNV